MQQITPAMHLSFADSFSIYSYQANKNPNLRLPNLGGDADTLTMSGFSSGSFTSTLQTIIHSEKIKGVGLYCGGPYGTFLYTKWGSVDDLKNISKPLI